MMAFLGDEPGAHFVADILRQIIRRKAQGFMSVINWGEVYYTVMREQGSGQAEQVVAQIGKYPIQIVAADKELTYGATRHKGQQRIIAYADCFAAALALKLKAEIVTGDPEFQRLAPTVPILWIASNENV